MRRIVLWLWFALLIRPIVRLVVGVCVFGRQRLPEQGPAIIIANHNSHLDTLVLMDLMPLCRLHRVRPVAAADYFDKSSLRRLVAIRCMNALLIPRAKFTRSTNPLDGMIEALDAGQIVILFPEGTRGRPEEIAPLKTGIAHLIAKRPEVPVTPVFMRNMGFSLPRGEQTLVPLFCDVFIGSPQRFAGGRDEIMAQIAACMAELVAEAEYLRPSAVPEDDR